jgi:hypothetical protein
VITRRQLLLSAAAFAATTSPFGAPLLADSLNGPALAYRDFTIDLSEAKDAPNLKAIVASLRHQIDIVADCGAKPQILDFFKSQLIFVRPGAGDGGGRFDAGSTGVSVDIAVDAPEKPVLLHELLHAYHYRVLPQGHDNPDILTFYQRALDGSFYPPDAYVLKNVQEFFAVTASLYLWGNVDRPPHDRRTLHDRQPVYYKWLGDQFGVVKSV